MTDVLQNVKLKKDFTVLLIFHQSVQLSVWMELKEETKNATMGIKLTLMNVQMNAEFHLNSNRQKLFMNSLQRTQRLSMERYL